MSAQRTHLPRSVFWLLVTPFCFLVVFLISPLIILFRASFFEGNRPLGQGFSLEHYEKFFADEFYLGVLIDTIAMGLASAAICTLLGYPIAYSLARLPAKMRRWRLIIVILPLTLSLVVVIFGWLVILGRDGLINTLLVNFGLSESPQRLLFTRGAVLVVLVQQFLPFMILSIMSVISQIDPVLEHAASTLRADRFTTFRRVTIPLSMPGVVAGFTLVFILTISAFITPKLIGGARIHMIGGLIYEQVLTVLNWPFAAAISFILLALTLVVLAAINLVAPRTVLGSK